MSEQWEPGDLALPDHERMPTKSNGALVVPFEVQRLLVFLYRQRQWKLPPAFHGHTVECYLTQVYRAIYYAEPWVVSLVREQLVEELKAGWRCKPMPDYIQELCAAAETMHRAWVDIGFTHTYSPVEPRQLPLSDSDQLRKRERNKARKHARDSCKPRRRLHKYRVRLDPD